MCRLFYLLLLVCIAGYAEAASLHFGVAPYLSARTLVLEYGPMCDFLSQQTTQKLRIGTAGSLRDYLRRVDAGDFDLILTPPHLARFAQQSMGFRPLVGIKSDFYALLLIHRNDPATTLSDIKGRTLNMPDRLSLVVQQVNAFLGGLGIDPERELRLRYHNTDNNAVLEMLRTPNAVAATSRAVYERMSNDITTQLRVLGSTSSTLSLVLMVHPRLDEAVVASLRDAMNRFPYSEPGLAYFNRTSSYIVPVDDAQLASYDTQLAFVRKELYGGGGR